MTPFWKMCIVYSLLSYTQMNDDWRSIEHVKHVAKIINNRDWIQLPWIDSYWIAIWLPFITNYIYRYNDSITHKTFHPQFTYTTHRVNSILPYIIISAVAFYPISVLSALVMSAKIRYNAGCECPIMIVCTRRVVDVFAVVVREPFHRFISTIAFG